MAKLYDVIVTTWVENPYKYVSYETSREVFATCDDEDYARLIAQNCVDMWEAAETGETTRFVNGSDYGSYVEDRVSGYATGVRVSVVPHPVKEP